jgi:hypothetical protein
VIYFLTTPESADTIRIYLEVAGGGLAGRLVPMVYDELFAASALPEGTYCFADLELLSDAARERAARRWDELAARECRLLNHPTRSLLRYELLRELRRRGVNTFDVYRLADGESPKRFPVFLRTANDHKGSISPLLGSAEELDAATAALRGRGERLDNKLVVEFCNTADPDGLYRKYGAFIVGERILPRHLFFSRHWVVKDWSVLDDALLREEQQYLATNPHERQLREIFAAARIEYGRIDYSLRDGEMQVWEINTNPIIIGMGPARARSEAPSGRGAGLRAALRPAWTRLTTRVPALARLREALAPPTPTAPPPPIPRATIHATFAAMLEPAWAAIDPPPTPPTAPATPPAS